jgi:hypothetical protein
MAAMRPEALRRFALSLPEAHEEPHHERTSFRVGGRIFATMTSDGQEAMVRVPSALEREELLASRPETFFGHGGWTTRYGALGVRLARVGGADMERLVTGSWSSVATKRARAELEARPKRRRRGRE